MSRPTGPLDRAQQLELAAALGESPFTVIPVARLLSGRCRATIMGKPGDPRAAVVQDDFCPEEPVAFGDDPADVLTLLEVTEGWGCVSVTEAMAEGLRSLLLSRGAARVRLYGDVYHELVSPLSVAIAPEARMLGCGDLALVASAPESLRGAGYDRPADLLAEGMVAGAVIEGRLVSIAHTYAVGRSYADIGVVTAEAHRNRGLSTSAAALLAHELLDRGLTPVWSCGEDNHASLRVAAKLGFREVGRMAYVIPQAR